MHKATNGMHQKPTYELLVTTYGMHQQCIFLSLSVSRSAQ